MIWPCFLIVVHCASSHFRHILHQADLASSPNDLPSQGASKPACPSFPRLWNLHVVSLVLENVAVSLNIRLVPWPYMCTCEMDKAEERSQAGG
jgi:hypothetical protein